MVVGFLQGNEHEHWRWLLVLTFRGACKYVHVHTVEKRNAHAKAASPDHRSALFVFPFVRDHYRIGGTTKKIIDRSMRIRSFVIDGCSGGK